jgi:hypothetical protein
VSVSLDATVGNSFDPETPPRSQFVSVANGRFVPQDATTILLMPRKTASCQTLSG